MTTCSLLKSSEPLLEDYVQGMPNEQEKLSTLKESYDKFKMPQEIDQQGT